MVLLNATFSSIYRNRFHDYLRYTGRDKCFPTCFQHPVYIFKQPMKPYKLIQVVNSDRSISPISSISSISLL